MKGFRSHHHPPSLDFSWRNIRKPAQQRTFTRRRKGRELTLMAGNVATARESQWDCAVERDPLLEEMGFAPASIDQLAQRTGLDAAKLAAHLSCLEIAGRVRALPGGWFQRVANGVIK